MEFSEQTKIYSAKYNLSYKDVIFCQLIAAGADRADSFAAIYHNAQTSARTRTQTADDVTTFLRNNPGAKVLIYELKNRQNKAPRNQEESEEGTQEGIKEGEKEGEKDDLTTRAGVLARLENICEKLGGKDQLQGLVTIAKIRGFDRPEEENEEEKRSYFLPWVSCCRSCALMTAYLNTLAEDVNK